ncbi:DUF2283 domain-containing protein [Patescibacteria group bacterium]|nr:DUF2283 domain-containing protein [Patescibacteria group bacterium]
MKKINQKIYYDKKTDVLWLNIKNGPEEEYKEVAPGIGVELNKKGELLGIEILNASKVLGSKLGFKTSKSSYSTAIPHKIR